MANGGFEDQVAAGGRRTVTEAAVHAFGVLTGDYSRMHFDHEFARSLEGGRPIAHGLLNACWALGTLTQIAPERLLIQDPRARTVGFEIRLTQVVSLGDTLEVHWSPSDQHALELASDDAKLGVSTSFEVLNQRGHVTSHGVVTALRDETNAWPDALPEPWPLESWCLPDPNSVFYAEDLLESGPRGETRGQTLTETDIVRFAREVGDLNPCHLNAEFARETSAGQRTVPPMLIFCLGFGEFLRALLEAPMPSSGFAGHVGDSWRAWQPVLIGDTIRTRHRPVRCERLRSRPGQAIVHFGLQFLNQRDEVVQDGQVAMMVPAGTASSRDTLR